MTERTATVSYHNQKPSFYDEIKIRLPPALSTKCVPSALHRIPQRIVLAAANARLVYDRTHALFSFYQVSCKEPKKKDKVEGPV